MTSTLKEMLAMKINEKTYLGDGLQIIRVDGGWIYVIIGNSNNTTVFVPESLKDDTVLLG